MSDNGVGASAVLADTATANAAANAIVSESERPVSAPTVQEAKQSKEAKAKSKKGGKTARVTYSDNEDGGAEKNSKRSKSRGRHREGEEGRGGNAEIESSTRLKSSQYHKKKRSNSHAYGASGRTGLAGSSRATSRRQEDGLDNWGDEDDDDETELLLTNDRRGFEVSGHHLSSVHQKTSNNQTLIHLIKGNLGTGILAMPDALRHSGLLTGCILLPVVAAICIHCMHMLVWCSQELQQRLQRSNLDYAHVGEAAFTVGPPRLRFLSTFARTTINAFLTITQMGFCCVYIVFMAANIKQVLDCAFPNSVWDTHAYIALISIPVFLISIIKTLRNLYYPSLASNMLIFVGLILLLTYLLKDLPNAYERTQFTSFKELPLFLATSIYAFEGIGVVLPLHRNMLHPEDLGGYNGVLNTAMILVTCLYICMGFYGYLKYGDLVEGSITLNLPRTEPLAMTISLIFVAAIFLTYALMLYVPVELIWPHLVAKFSRFTRKRFTIYFFRGGLVLITLIFAVLIPHIGLFISLVGAMASSTLALIFPPLLHSLTFWDTSSRAVHFKNLLICVFGLICFVLGSISSIEAIVKALVPSLVGGQHITESAAAVAAPITCA